MRVDQTLDLCSRELAQLAHSDDMLEEEPTIGISSAQACLDMCSDICA